MSAHRNFWDYRPQTAGDEFPRELSLRDILQDYFTFCQAPEHTDDPTINEHVLTYIGEIEQRFEIKERA